MTRRKRLWASVCALGVAFLAWLWLFSDQIRQMQMIYTYALVLEAGIGLVVWRLWYAKLSRKHRRRYLALLAVATLFFGSAVRFRGLTGDWLPILEWRWARGVDWEARKLNALYEGPVSNRPEIDLSGPVAFPSFLGPNGDSTISGLPLARDWQQQTPRLIWRKEIGAGWAGFSIVDGVAYTLEQRGDNEATVAYDLETGRQRWIHSHRAYFSNPMSGPGPRTTPTVSQTQVFSLGAAGALQAFDRVTGELQWRHDIVEENGARLPEHGMSGSPLLVDGLLVVSAGGPKGRSLVAYDQASGDPVWTGGDDAAGFGPPVLATLAGKRQILLFNHSSVVGHDPSDGSILWQYPWPANYPNVAPPLVVGADRVMFSTGYGVGAKMLRICTGDDGAQAAELLWESPRMKAKFTNLVLHEGFIYGLDDGVMVCLDPDTGERRWKRGRYGHGNILLVDDVLLVQTEKGEIVMLDPNPEELRELTRFRALRGKAWNHFALVDPYLLVRNDKEAALWELPLSSI